MAAASPEARECENEFVKHCCCRRDGYIPALALGDVRMHEDAGPYTCIQGLCFESIYPDGDVHAFIASDEFSDVVWDGQFDLENATPLMIREWDDFEVPPRTSELADIICYACMTVVDFVQQQGDDMGEVESLHEALHIRKPYRHRHDYMILSNEGLVPTDPPGGDLMKTFLQGFEGGKEYGLLPFLQLSVPNIASVGQGSSSFTISPAETSNRTLSEGVPHCLVYGKSVLKGEGRSRKRYRKILLKRPGDSSRSRSRENLPDVRDVPSIEEFRDVKNYEGNEHFLQVRHFNRAVDRNPENVLVVRSSIDKFAESQKPDAVLIHDYECSPTGFHVKLVLEICSYNRYSPVFETSVLKATSHCVRSCLAALQTGQTKILGLCAFVDGLKLIKVLKNEGRWVVSESHVAGFGDINGITSFLCALNEELAEE